MSAISQTPDQPDALPRYELTADTLPVRVVERLLSSRRMTRVRALIASERRQCLAYLAQWQPGLPDGRAAVPAKIAMLDEALAEVEAAERGCGVEAGECTWLCHAGVRHPDPDPGRSNSGARGHVC